MEIPVLVICFKSQNMATYKRKKQIITLISLKFWTILYHCHETQSDLFDQPKKKKRSKKKKTTKMHKQKNQGKKIAKA